MPPGRPALCSPRLVPPAGAAFGRSGARALSIAVIEGAGIRYSRALGTAVRRGLEADEDTVFRAASLSKPVFAYLVMSIVADGKMGLDTPLQDYLPRPLSEYPDYSDLASDGRASRLTARLALTHRTGFPNWRWHQPDKRLRFLFEPGERFSYSGERYGCLQLVLEQVAGKGLEELSRERVFRPLGMRRTSWHWREEFATNLAFERAPIDKAFGPGFLDRAVAAGSLLTTASDYARFLGAVLSGQGLPRHLRDEMLRPQVAVSSDALFGPAAPVTTPEQGKGLPIWALGWGGFFEGGAPARFHVGYDSPEFENYAVIYPTLALGLVVLTSGGQGPAALSPEVVEAALGDTAAPFGWMGY